MATIRQVSIHVSRKISKDYNSTDHSYGVTLDFEAGDDFSETCAEWTARLKDEIRKAFAKPNANGPQTTGHGYTADRPVQTTRNSDPEPYVAKEPVIDPLTQRPVPPEKRTSNTTDQAIARGHLPDPNKPQTWPSIEEEEAARQRQADAQGEALTGTLVDVEPAAEVPAAFR